MLRCVRKSSISAGPVVATRRRKGWTDVQTRSLKCTVDVGVKLLCRSAGTTSPSAASRAPITHSLGCAWSVSHELIGREEGMTCLRADASTSLLVLTCSARRNLACRLQRPDELRCNCAWTPNADGTLRTLRACCSSPAPCTTLFFDPDIWIRPCRMFVRPRFPGRRSVPAMNARKVRAAGCPYNLLRSGAHWFLTPLGIRAVSVTYWAHVCRVFGVVAPGCFRLCAGDRQATEVDGGHEICRARLVGPAPVLFRSTRS